MPLGPPAPRIVMYLQSGCIPVGRGHGGTSPTTAAYRTAEVETLKAQNKEGDSETWHDTINQRRSPSKKGGSATAAWTKRVLGWCPELHITREALRRGRVEANQGREQ